MGHSGGALCLKWMLCEHARACQIGNVPLNAFFIFTMYPSSLRVACSCIGLNVQKGTHHIAGLQGELHSVFLLLFEPVGARCFQSCACFVCGSRVCSPVDWFVFIMTTSWLLFHAHSRCLVVSS